MPTPSTNPLRLQVIDRIVTVLAAITTGSSYWYTPKKVSKGLLNDNQIPGYPCYMVTDGEKGGPIKPVGLPYHHDEIFNVSIHSIIKSSSDTVSMNIKALADVRKAIHADSISGAAGSLGVIAVSVWFVEGPDMDDGVLLKNYGYFVQNVQVTINGEFGEL